MIQIDENGWVFDPLDKFETFNFLLKCIKRKSKLELMGKKSIEIVTQHTPQHAADAIIDACKIALKNRKKKIARSHSS